VAMEATHPFWLKCWWGLHCRHYRSKSSHGIS
jgi:hypothetical protein